MFGGRPVLVAARGGYWRGVPLGSGLTRIDQAVEARLVKVPRHTWLMEAVIEKLEREAKAPS